MDLNSVADLSRIERVVLLVDLHHLLHRRHLSADDYISPLLAAARRILSYSSFSGSAADADATASSPLFAYKFFFSSLSPILSSSAVHRLLGKSATFLSFDRPASTFASLSRSLCSLAGASASPANGDGCGTSSAFPRASLLAQSLLQLEHDYGWELPQDTPKHRPEMLATRSNLVLLFSPVPQDSNFFSDSIDLEAGSDGKSQDGVLDVFLEKFIGTFSLVKERLMFRDIQLGWVDVNVIDDSGCRKQEVLTSNIFVKGIEELGWGFLSTDAIVLGSALVPSALLLPYVACSMPFKSDDGLKKGILELFLEITDVNGKPLECKSCDLELLDVYSLIGRLSIDSSCRNTLDHGISKMRVRKIWRKNEGQKLASNACGFLLLQGVTRGLSDRVDCHEEEFLADKVLKFYCGVKGKFIGARPIWQLLLSFLHKRNFCASISVDGDDGNVIEGILFPFTVNYALLAVLHKNSLDSSCYSIYGKNNSSFEKNNGNFSNKHGKKEGRWEKHSVHASQFQTLTWKTFRDSLLTCSDDNDLQLDLEDLYFSRKSKKTKKLKFLKCWMSQITKCSGGSCTVEDEAKECCDVKEDTELRLIDQGENLEADVISSSAEACPSGSMSDETSPLFPLEDPDSFLIDIPKKIEQGLCSGDADLGILAERLVILSIQALYIKYGRKENRTSHEEEEVDPDAKIAAEVFCLLLRKPKDLIAKYKTTNPSTIASSPTSVTYGTEYKIREHELQILFRMEILKSRIRSNIDEKVKLKMIKDLCSLLQFIDINIQGESFSSQGILEFAERTLKLRYSESMRDVICEIYRQMEFDLFDEDEDGDEDEVEVSESVPNSNSCECKYENNKADRAPGSQDENSQTQQEIMDHAHEQRLIEAQERRNRNRRFSSFTSWMPDLQRVWARKQSKAEKPTHDPVGKQSKRRRRRISTNDMVYETPMPARTDNSNSSFRQECDACSGTNHCKSLSKALFHDGGDVKSGVIL